MANSVKKTRRQLVVDIIIVLLIAALIIILIVILNSGKETVTTTTTEQDEKEVLICKNHDDEKSFFKSSYKPSTVGHELRIIVSNNKLETITMTYTGTYDDPATAERARALMHADHNILLGSNNISEDVFSSLFNSEGNVVRIELFGKANDINSVTSRFFYIDTSEFYKVKNMSSSGLKTTFENKGFSCSYQN